MTGEALGPYRLDRVLGEGGMGRVWAARVEGRVPGIEPGTLVALKVVHPHLLETPGFFKRFLREAEIGKSVLHGNVVRTLDCDAVSVGGAQHHFLVMEYVEGRTLRTLLQELECVPEELCRHIGREVAQGLAAIHAAGVIHRDVKPENVLLTREDAVKVMDLGVARLAAESLRLSRSGVFVGSVEYAAPEQFGGGAVGSAADIHAVGVMLYELATGQHPYRADDFRGVMRRVLDAKPRRPAEVHPQISPFLEELILQLLEKDPAQRLGSAADLARVLAEGERSAWWRERSRALRAATRRPLRRVRVPRETEIHGREAELARLRTAYGEARSGAGRVLLIEGEAGIGKSRLVDEFVAALVRDGEDLNFLFGSYPPGGAATAAGAFSAAYREHFGEDGSAAWLPQTPILVPAFDALLRGEPAPAGAEPLTKDSLQTVFVHATRNLAAERPTIVLIDDLHFAPEEGRALFVALALAVQGHRVLLVGTSRPGLDGKWLANLARVGVERIALPRLGAKDLVRLLQDAFRSERLAEELGAKIALKSDGNPYFAFEIVRGLREGQFIGRRDDGTWVTTKEIGELAVPSSVLELVQARVADLAPAERSMLDVASCLGFEFDPAVVAAVLGLGRIPLLQSLAQVEKSHRLVRSAGRRFAFDHHQVQESLYAALPELLREEYHAAIGEALESLHARDPRDGQGPDGPLRVEVCDHFLRGGRGPRSLPHLDAALAHLESGYLNDAAIRLAGRALAAPGLLDGRARCELLLRQASRLGVVARRDEQGQALEEALALAERERDPALLARVLCGLGAVRSRTGRHDEAQAMFERALDLARTSADRRGEMLAVGNLGNLFLNSGRFQEAAGRLEASLEIARSLGDRRAEAVVTGNMSNVLQYAGRLAEAREWADRCGALAESLGDRRLAAHSAGTLAGILLDLGRVEEARGRIERSLELARATGDRATEGYGFALLGSALGQLGRLAEALGPFGEALRIARDTSDPWGRSRALLNIGLTQSALGARDEARASFESALETARATGSLGQEGQALLCLALVADAEGDRGRAFDGFSEALAVLRNLGSSVSLRSALIEFADHFRRSGDAERARCAIDEALRLARDAGRGEDLGLALAVAACLPGGDPEAALAAVAAVPATRVDPRVPLLLWQATGRTDCLESAVRQLEAILAANPADRRESILTRVALHREIVAAARAAGRWTDPPATGPAPARA